MSETHHTDHKKIRLIQRILNHTEVFEREELSRMNEEELRSIISRSMIGLRIRMDYINRHKTRPGQNN